MKTKITIKEITEAGHDESEALRVAALCQFLDCAPDDLKQERHDHYGLTLFEYGSQSYAVGTDAEADAACVDYCRDSVWAFNASFILEECGLPSELEDAIQAFQSDKCESANDALLALVEKCCKGGIKEFTESAIGADGRGHFLSGYDGNENEETVSQPDTDDNTALEQFFALSDGKESITLYIYRTN